MPPLGRQGEIGYPREGTPATSRPGATRTYPGQVTPLTVGFDLDLTLVDSRAGIVATMQAALARDGVAVDEDAVAATIGIPLESALARWLPSARVSAAADRYRELYPSLGIPATTLRPGAAEAIAAIRRENGRVVVVTAKAAPLAEATLAAVGLAVDDVAGHAYAAEKGVLLAERGATVYVGDHPGDMVAARIAGATGVGVLTGTGSGDALRAEGADAVLADLTRFPAWLSGHLLPPRLAALEERLRGLGSVLVAFSGGADSAFLLAAAVRALGPDRVVAATAVSPSLATTERELAGEVAAALGVRHLTPRTDEMAREGYRANAGDRCAHCKSELLDVLRPLAAEHRLAAVATGTNADDARDPFRPGIAAARDRGAVTPLLDAGLTKAQVRAASRAWGLVTWDKPAAACLSSRVAYGVEITPDRLSRVERAEFRLRVELAHAGLTVRDLRVRDLGDRASVEVDRELVDALAARPDLLAAVEGFDVVEVDPRGFRSGSMNDLLPRG